MTRRLVSFDWVIKKLLRSKANFGILEGFLSELLFTDIKILEVLESESNKEDRYTKFNRVDLKVKDKENKIILVEIQFEREWDYHHRILFSTSKAVSEHLVKGSPYSKVSKIISVNILYFVFGKEDDYIYHGKTKFFGMHNHKELELSDKQKKLYQIEKVDDIYPEYYLIEVSNFDNIARNTLDEWIYFLKNEEIKDSFKAKGLLEAKKKLDVLLLPESERKKYESHSYELHYEASMYESSYLDGKMDGKEEGRKEGRKEERRKLLIAKKMLEKKTNIENVLEMTGLTKEEIERLS